MPTRSYERPGRAIEIGRTIGRRIAAARKRKNWTQSDLAEALGCHQVTVARWETGTSPIAAIDLVLAAAYLDCTPGELMPSPGREAAGALPLRAAADEMDALAARLRAAAEAYEESEAGSDSAA